MKTFWRIEDAGWAVTDYVKHCNELLLSGAIGYLTTHAKIAGQEKEVYAARDAKLETAREKSRLRRAAVLQHVPLSIGVNNLEESGRRIVQSCVDAGLSFGFSPKAKNLSIESGNVARKAILIPFMGIAATSRQSISR